MKFIVHVLFVVLLCGVSFANANEKHLKLGPGVDAHEGVDAIYTDFTRSYQTLNPGLVANLYTEDASYLSPSRDITKGRKLILENFTRFFQNVKQRGQSMVISFEIVQRKIGPEMGFDIGYFRITFSKDGKVTNTSTGKFVVVAVLDSDKKWRFQVDGYSNLPKPQNN